MQPKAAAVRCGRTPQHLKSPREAICGQKTSQCCFMQIPQNMKVTKKQMLNTDAPGRRQNPI